MVPTTLPKHIAIIMDGNGRWASKRHFSRMTGHKVGVESTREIIKCCKEIGINVLTLFTFSSENWHRPAVEVENLLDLLLSSLTKELPSLKEQEIRLRFIGNWQQFNRPLREKIQAASTATQNFSGMQLVIAVNYGGRWDIVNAARHVCEDVVSGNVAINDINEKLFADYISLKELPEPDLFIRTSGEYRISNFLLWSFAYTELYFTDVLWPDFKREQLLQALSAYAKRQRRFGRAS